MRENDRRFFLKKLTMSGIGMAIFPSSVLSGQKLKNSPQNEKSIKEVNKDGYRYAQDYEKDYLNHIAYPVGGLGAGMFCVEGNGAISHVSIRNHPEMFNEPGMFAAISVKGIKNGAKVIEGPVPEWKVFGRGASGLGDPGAIYGLPRFDRVAFSDSFPFAKVSLADNDLPLSVELKAWSPFIPTDEDNSGLPVGSLIYTFVNHSQASVDAVFSFNSKNFTASDGGAINSIEPMFNGFVLKQGATKDKPFLQSNFAVFTNDKESIVDHCWFRGNWWDPLTMAWNNIQNCTLNSNKPVEKDAPGASLFVPFTLAPGKSKTIHLKLAWYSPDSNLACGEPTPGEKDPDNQSSVLWGEHTGKVNNARTYKPWYASKFENIAEVTDYWEKNYSDLLRKTQLFNTSFYKSTLPEEVINAVAANLSILKSPTVLRQYDGRLWCWEGSGDDEGSCYGSCTHVWNYAQAIAHLFPALERTLRNTEFNENQSKSGHQVFRTNLPISPAKHDFHSASDGQLGGILKVYRDWRISGDNEWLVKIFPLVKISMDYCINTWDPKHKGIIEEPHHNTYDIEFWGPDGMITSFYLGALKSMELMGAFLKEEVHIYQELYSKGKIFMEHDLFNGEYFFQKIEFKGLRAPDPTMVQSFGGAYSPEAKTLLKKEGPKYQYGSGCLSDGILGAWMGRMCGLNDFVDTQKIAQHLSAIHKYNLKNNLKEHSNPQRPGYALGAESGLLLCSWPKGDKLSIPFVYSNEVWTGIEYQVASHLMLMGSVKKGLDIVRACRNRYNGRIRNPFNEYECGHWYARALSSYGLLQGLTGLRYDAVDKVLYVNSQIGDFSCFLSTATGFGNVFLKDGKVTIEMAYGKIDMQKIEIEGHHV